MNMVNDELKPDHSTTLVPVHSNEVELMMRIPGVDRLLDLIDASDNEPLDNILWDLRERNRQAWLAMRNGRAVALMLTMIKVGKVKEMWITHLVGEQRATWLDHWPLVREWALEIGCHRVVSLARPGWARVMRDQGFRQSHIMLEHDLKEEADGQLNHNDRKE